MRDVDEAVARFLEEAETGAGSVDGTGARAGSGAGGACSLYDVGLLVGPEGGFTDAEREAFVALEAASSSLSTKSMTGAAVAVTVRRVTLGDGVLRAETAAIAGLVEVTGALERARRRGLGKARGQQALR